MTDWKKTLPPILFAIAGTAFFALAVLFFAYGRVAFGILWLALGIPFVALAVRFYAVGRKSGGDSEPPKA